MPVSADRREHVDDDGTVRAGRRFVHDVAWNLVGVSDSQVTCLAADEKVDFALQHETEFLSRGYAALSHSGARKPIAERFASPRRFLGTVRIAPASRISWLDPVKTLRET